MARSITFTVEGLVDTQITVLELDDGTLRFDIDVLGSGFIGDLRGLFFDLNGYDVDSNDLSVTGVDGSEGLIGKSKFGENSVDRVHGDVNVKGHVIAKQGRFDGGIEFGTQGLGKDDVSSVSFILAADSGDLSLDSLDLADLALRYTSVGMMDYREGSAKIAGMTSGVAYNDAFEVDENTQGTIDLLDNDTNGIQAGGLRKTVISVQDTVGLLPAAASADGFERTVVIEGLVLGTLTISNDGYATFVADGADVDKLGHDAIKTWNFTYETQSSTGNLATADVVLTIDGQNDQPLAFDVSASVGEDDASDPRDTSLVGDGVTVAFSATDIDIGDVLSYQITSAPVDTFGNQYGEVTNNNDGTFTFNPLDNFQFLDAGESRDVTFQYVAIDDSGVGITPVSPEESDTSDPKTITITVNGSDDAPWTHEDQLLFITEDQSMFGTGDALIFQPDLPFLGFDSGYQSLYATIIPSYTFSGDVLEGILGGIEAVGQAFADAGCEVGSWFGADCDVDVDIPSSITTPRVGTDGFLDAKIGLQPYFYFTSGDVDAEIPVDVFFEYPRQVEAGETFTIDSLYSLDDGATFTTMSPNVNFGMDFILDVAADLDLKFGSSSIGLFDFDTDDFSGFEGELGEPGFNILNFSAEDDLEESIDLGNYGTLDLNFPVINTTGELDPLNSNTLISSGEDDVAVLDIDIDALAAKLITVATGVPFSFGESGSEGATVSVAGESLNLLSVDYAIDLLAVNLITTLKAVQDFELSVTDLPLLAMLEDGSTITGFSLGDEVIVTAPENSAFDADVDGDADGFIDFSIEVDMDAIFDHLAWLGLDMEIFTGLLRFDVGVTSDFASNLPTFSLFDPNGDDDGFLLAETTELFSDVPLATLFDDEFVIEGWNADTTSFLFDIA